MKNGTRVSENDSINSFQIILDEARICGILFSRGRNAFPPVAEAKTRNCIVGATAPEVCLAAVVVLAVIVMVLVAVLKGIGCIMVAFVHGLTGRRA